MMLYDVKEWATIVRASQFYLRALRRKKHEKTHPKTPNLGAYKLDQKIREASRFTPYYHY